METPRDALESAIWRIHLICSRKYQRPDSPPGQLILDLPEKQRELLRELKSDDIADLRPETLIL